MDALERKLIEKLSNYRDAAPVHRIEPRPLDELESVAANLARRIAGGKEQERSRAVRGKGQSDIALADGYRARVYHASGAVAVRANFAPMEHLLGEKVDKGVLTEKAKATVKRLGLDRIGTAIEKLSFERLWQIKATGINRDHQRGREVVCRAVGAFRRHVNELPVYGRSSVVVELAGGEKVGGAGVDWRPVVAEAVDRAKVLDPERAAREVVADIAGRLPGAEFTREDFDVTLFALGYFSFPKRRAQGLLPLVYVALLERRGWSSMNYVVVVNGTEKVYENVARIATLPPRESLRPGARGPK